MRDRLLRAALALADRGIRVFPCVPRGKTPATAHGVLDATADRSAIGRWWSADPDCNVAIATGSVSGLFVIDFDGLDAEGEMRKLETRHDAMPTTVEVITARGRHLYFKTPNTSSVPNSVGRVAPGVDVRGNGGYVLAPPSVHPTGKRYCWSVDSGNAIVDAPAWLLGMITDSASGNGAATPPSEWRRLATDGVAQGARNDSVARLIGHLLRRRVDPFVALELIRTWNAVRCRPPLPDKEIEQVVNSVAGRELKRRQSGNVTRD